MRLLMVLFITALSGCIKSENIPFYNASHEEVFVKYILPEVSMENIAIESGNTLFPPGKIEDLIKVEVISNSTTFTVTIDDLYKLKGSEKLGKSILVFDGIKLSLMGRDKAVSLYKKLNKK